MRLSKSSFRRRPPQADDEHPPSKRARHACSTPRRLPRGHSGSRHLPRGHGDPLPSLGTSRWIPEPWNRTAFPGGSTGTEKSARRVLRVGNPSPCSPRACSPPTLLLPSRALEGLAALKRRVHSVRKRQQALCGKILLLAISGTRSGTGKVTYIDARASCLDSVREQLLRHYNPLSLKELQGREGAVVNFVRRSYPPPPEEAR